MAGAERNPAGSGQTHRVSWREVDDEAWDADLDADDDSVLGPRRWGWGMVALAWLLVIAMLGSALAAFVVLVLGR